MQAIERCFAFSVRCSQLPGMKNSCFPTDSARNGSEQANIKKAARIQNWIFREPEIKLKENDKVSKPNAAK